MTGEVLIEAKHLALIRGNRRLFHSLSFSLHKGQAIHLCGKNGSGKTSLFKILTGLRQPNAGSLTLWGKSFKTFEPDDYQKLLYLGHQTAVKSAWTVEDNLLFNARLFDSVEVNKKMLHHALKSVGLWAFRSQVAEKLSAGQKRRISLARLWIAPYRKQPEERVWLLDEPLTDLDTDFINVLQERIDAHLASGGGVIFSSHQPLSLGGKVSEVNLGNFR